ncbi:MAG TPA: DUF1573 domain-containing protein [Clostridium sp.]|uniref:DUF1573 domain-containing protein n=1 Tax=unclassified Clostridium TaxID=2614128 RepID=UPI000ED01D5F|nr:DUF1573 domain-containing protein [Clostridium sp.]
MKDLIFDEFQNSVDSSLLRHKSILDILSKLHESESRVNRSVIKAVTSCGCVKIKAEKQNISYSLSDDNENNLDKLTLGDLQIPLSSHIDGKICDSCRKVIEREIGNHLFYITSLCNSLDINLYDVLLTEYKNITTFDKINLR